MTKIKICGITREKDVDYINEFLPDYVGFIFAPSKRQVAAKMARELISSIDKSIKTVGVFQNQDVSLVKSISEYLKIDIIQLHGGEDNDYINKLSSFSLWKAYTIDVDSEKFMGTIDCDADGILIDSSLKGVTGGTGARFKWDVLKDIQLNKKLILAGGLNPENVREAINITNPYAVDVSSGVEENGIKDYEKIKKFIYKVREML